MRGEEYYETDAVSELEEISPGEWTATVEGTDDYNVEISMAVSYTHLDVYKRQAHARQIAAYYNAHGVSAVAIDSKTPASERRELVEGFRQGRIRVLVNVDIFSEGFDCPDVEFVQLARPTLSLAKYLQQVEIGRAHV